MQITVCNAEHMYHSLHNKKDFQQHRMSSPSLLARQVQVRAHQLNGLSPSGLFSLRRVQMEPNEPVMNEPMI